MKSLKSLKLLIRLRKKTLDDMLYIKNLMESDKAQKQHNIESKNQKLKDEIKNFTNSEYGIYLANFRKNTEYEINKLEQEIQELDTKIEMMEESIRDIFSEIKRFEIIMEKRIAEEAELKAKEEMKFIDEINTIKETNQKNAEA